MTTSPEVHNPTLVNALLDEAERITKAARTALAAAESDLQIANEGIKFEQVIRGICTVTQTSKPQ